MFSFGVLSNYDGGYEWSFGIYTNTIIGYEQETLIDRRTFHTTVNDKELSNIQSFLHQSLQSYHNTEFVCETLFTLFPRIQFIVLAEEGTQEVISRQSELSLFQRLITNDYDVNMKEKTLLSSYKRILSIIEILKEGQSDLYKSLSWTLHDCDEELNVEQMTEYCKKRIKELEGK